MQAARTYPQKKVQMYKVLADNAQKSRVIALVKMEKVRATQLMPLRKKFRDQMRIIMVKNNIAKKSLANIKVQGIDKLVQELEGQNVMMFTDMDPFKLFLVLDKSKIYLPAKGGDIATEEVMVNAGNTGLPPGPVLTEFREAKIPTKIEGGTVWISEDTVVANPGDAISHKLASLLGKLGIKPIKASMAVHAALQEGVLYRREDLRIDLEETVQELQRSASEALSLAVNAAYATAESIAHLIRKAFGEARALSTNSGYMTKETASDILYATESKALAVLEKAKQKGYS